MAYVRYCRLALVMLALATLPITLAGTPPSENLLGFLSAMSGRYVEESLKSDVTEHLTEKAIPVRIPAFDPDYTFLYEETVNDALYRRHIFVVSEGDNEIINVKPYNITDLSLAQDVDVNSLQELPRQAFSFDKDCTLKYRRVSGNIYFGTWPDCNIRNEGVIAMYASVWACDSESFIVLDDLSKESRGRLPYVMRKQAPGVPLLPYMTEGVENFVNPCQTSLP